MKTLNEYLLTKDNPETETSIERVPMEEIWQIGGSFHDCYVKSSVNELTNIIGKPERMDGDKTNYEWGCRCEGILFYIYDWREPGFTKNAIIDFHIGSSEKEDSEKAVEFLKSVKLNAYKEKNPWS